MFTFVKLLVYKSEPKLWLTLVSVRIFHSLKYHRVMALVDLALSVWCTVILYATESIYFFSGLEVHGAAQITFTVNSNPILASPPNVISQQSGASFAEKSNSSISLDMNTVQTAVEYTGSAASARAKPSRGQSFSPFESFQSLSLKSTQKRLRNDMYTNARRKSSKKKIQQLTLDNERDTNPVAFEKKKPQTRKMAPILGSTLLPYSSIYSFRINQGQAAHSTTKTVQGIPISRTRDDNLHSSAEYTLDSKKGHNCITTPLRDYARNEFSLRTAEAQLRPPALSRTNASIGGKGLREKGEERQCQTCSFGEFEGKSLTTDMHQEGFPKSRVAKSNRDWLLQLPHKFAKVAKNELETILFGDDLSHYTGTFVRTNPSSHPTVHLHPALRGRTGVGASIEHNMRLPPMRGLTMSVFAALSGVSGFIPLPVAFGIGLLGIARQFRSELQRNIVARAVTEAEKQRLTGETPKMLSKM